MKRYIINGQAQSGKNSFASKIKEKIKSNLIHISTVDPIKEFLEENYRVKEKTEEVRILISGIKNLLDDYDMLTNKEACEFCEYTSFDIVFIDCREPKNIEDLKNRFLADKNTEVKTILMIRPMHNISSCEKDDFEFVSNYKYDYVFECNDVDEVGVVADFFIESEKLI